jgi:iron complex transport system substrate-binding protein
MSFRRSSIAAALTTVSALLAGCTPSSTPGVAGVTGEGTFTFEHVAGRTQVPVDPERIVTLQDQNALLPLLELGIEPVGSAAQDNGDGTHRFRRTEGFDTDGVAFVGPHLEPNLEAVAALRPDLIVGTEFNLGIYDQLSAIAPTVLIQIFDRPLTEVLADFAVLVGRQEQQARLQAEYEEAVRQLVQDLPRPPEEIELSWISFGEPGQFYISSGQAVGTVLEDVGFARPEAERRALEDGSYEYSSFETLSDHDADLLIAPNFAADAGLDGLDPEVRAALDAPVLQGLDVARRGEVHIFDGGSSVGAAYSRMMSFLEFLRDVLVEREPSLRPR